MMFTGHRTMMLTGHRTMMLTGHQTRMLTGHQTMIDQTLNNDWEKTRRLLDIER